MKNFSPYQLVLILIPFVINYALGLDIYLPILPLMTDIFQTTPFWIQLTMGLFLLTTGVGQLFIGPFADRFGRRPILLVSSLLFAAGSLACAYSQEIQWLIAARFFSALGACGMLVAAFAIVRDNYSGKESAKIYSLLNGAVGISPTFSPMIGTLLNLYFGWQSVFFFLTIAGSISFLLTTFFIPETRAPNKPEANKTKILSNYKKIFSNKQFLNAAILAGFGDAILFCFFSIAPFILIESLAVPANDFGYYFANFGLAIAIGGWLSGKIVEKKGIETTLSIGVALVFVGAIAMLVSHFFLEHSIATFLIPMTPTCIGAMFLIGCAAALALEPFADKAGAASAALGAVHFGISAFLGTILMSFPLESLLPSAIMMTSIAVGSYALLLIRKSMTHVILQDSM